jgi:hypothetical protein
MWNKDNGVLRIISTFAFRRREPKKILSRSGRSTICHFYPPFLCLRDISLSHRGLDRYVCQFLTIQNWENTWVLTPITPKRLRDACLFKKRPSGLHITFKILATNLISWCLKNLTCILPGFIYIQKILVGKTEATSKATHTLSVKLNDFTVWRYTWRKNWLNCAVLTGNIAGLITVLSSRLSHTENCAVHSGNPTVSSVYLPTPRWHHLKALNLPKWIKEMSIAWYIPFQMPLLTPHFMLSFLLFG